MAKLRETIAEGESALRDLGALLAAEQQRLSQVFVGRREAFLKQTQMIAQKELAERLSSDGSLSSRPLPICRSA